MKGPDGRLLGLGGMKLFWTSVSRGLVKGFGGNRGTLEPEFEVAEVTLVAEVTVRMVVPRSVDFSCSSDKI